jgi:hypothetical protein
VAEPPADAVATARLVAALARTGLASDHGEVLDAAGPDSLPDDPCRSGYDWPSAPCSARGPSVCAATCSMVRPDTTDSGRVFTGFRLASASSSSIFTSSQCSRFPLPIRVRA